ncbi:hypothetical protein [Kitasatospora purpeofusca]|uniref:hypothetical protein n=1 Tax=Kitasatospora purpeofusca TaxID=67352 RepID=UPI00380143C5
MDETPDRFLPLHGHRTVHGITLAASPEQPWAALPKVTLADLPLPRMLLALLIRPGVGLIRRSALAAVGRHCEGS